MNVSSTSSDEASTGDRLYRRLHWVGPITIVVFGLLIYAHTFTGPFHLDDYGAIVGNTAIRNLSEPAEILRYGRGRSLTIFTFALNYAVHGDRVFGYHVVNIGIHLANALLLSWLTLLLCRAPLLRNRPEASEARWIALLAGLLFVAHPLQTQAVTYIVQRLESLAAGFYLLCVALYLTARLQKLAGKSWSGWYAASLAVAVLGGFAKETMVSIAGAILLVEIGLFTPGRGEWRQTIGRQLPWIAPYLLVGAMVPVARWLASASPGSAAEALAHVFGSSRLHSRWEYLVTQIRVVAAYLRLTLLPTWQIFDPSVRASGTLWEGPALGSLALLGLLAAAAVRWLRRWPLQAVGVLWAFVTILPTSSIVVIFDLMFEHRMYLPLAGGSVALAAALLGARRLAPRRGAPSTIAVACTIAVVLLLGVLTVRRNLTWTSSRRLWEDTVRKSPWKPRPHINLGSVFNDAGMLDRAVAQLKVALRLNPVSVEALNNLAVAFERSNMPQHQFTALSRAHRLDPRYVTVLSNLGLWYLKRAEFDRAILRFKETLRLVPRHVKALNNLGVAFGRLRLPRHEFAAYQRARGIDADEPEALSNLGQWYVKAGRHDRGMLRLKQALWLVPNEAAYLNNLGTLYGKLGRQARAFAIHRQATAIDPSLPASSANLSNVYASLQQLDRAFHASYTSLSLQPQQGEVYHNLGNLFVRIGRPGLAEGAMRRAVRLRGGSAKTHAALGRIADLLRKRDMAVAEVKRALFLDPRRERSWKRLGAWYRRGKRYRQAGAAYRKALGIHFANSNTWDALGEMLNQQRLADRATAAYLQSLALAPAVPSTWNALGVSYALGGHARRGVETLLRALKMRPAYEQAHSNLGTLFSEAQRFDAALCQFKIALALNPSRLETQFNVAGMLNELQQFDRALLWYERFKQSWRGSARLAKIAQREIARLRGR